MFRGMKSTRMEAFSDGVLAILITIMVLELRAPAATSLEALRPMEAVFLAYVLSFINLGIYWNNHHHMLQTTECVTGASLWANLHLMFWLSLFPFGTAWMGENRFAPVPTAVYGGILLAAAIAYYLLQRTIIRAQGPDSVLQKAIGKDLKGKLSPVIYAVAIPMALFWPWLAVTLYFVVSLIWLVPDPRIERTIA